MYDRVAGDDIDTGDELESLEHSKKEKNSINIYHDPSQAQKSLRGSNDDNTKDVLITHNYNKVKNNNVYKDDTQAKMNTMDRRENSYLPEDVEEEKVVMRITPRPPVRKRPKSTPVLDHVSNQLSQMMEDKMR